MEISDLQKALRYCPDTGKMYRYVKSLGCEVEAMATVHGQGYLNGGVCGEVHLAHRVAWAIHYGEWPKGQIDHINGDKQDNRIENLRVVTHKQNGRNLGIQRDNTSGYPGVMFSRVASHKNKPWRAVIKVDGKRKCLGLHNTFFDAVCSRKLAEQKHGFNTRV